MKKYDLEDRTYEFANKVKLLVNCLPRNIPNIEYSKQLIRSSGSIRANYIEANEVLGKKDFVLRIKISRKEAKESNYWLKLLDTGNDNKIELLRSSLQSESLELTKIFGSIVERSK